MSIDGRTALVTGATGFLGSFLCERLLEKGYTVHGLVRPKESASPQERAFSALYTVNSGFVRDRLHVIPGDITRACCGLTPDIIDVLRGKIQELWHCAAVTSFDDELRDKIWLTNVDGTQHAIDLAKSLGISRVYLVSTAFVASRNQSVAMEAPVDLKTEFANVYEESKAHSEHLVANSGVPYVILRLPVITGRRSDGLTRQYLGFYVFARLFHYLRNEVIAQLEDPETSSRLMRHGFKISDERFSQTILPIPTLRLPVHIRCRPAATLNLLPIDLVIDSMMNAVAIKAPSGTIFHITNGTPPTVKELFGMALKYLGIVDIELGPEPASRTNSKAKITDAYEEMIHSRTAAYAPYLFGEPNFSRTNFATLVGSDLPDFKCTEEYIRKILEHAIAFHWRVPG